MSLQFHRGLFCHCLHCFLQENLHNKMVDLWVVYNLQAPVYCLLYRIVAASDYIMGHLHYKLLPSSLRRRFLFLLDAVRSRSPTQLWEFATKWPTNEYMSKNCSCGCLYYSVPPLLSSTSTPTKHWRKNLPFFSPESSHLSWICSHLLHFYFFFFSEHLTEKRDYNLSLDSVWIHAFIAVLL